MSEEKFLIDIRFSTRVKRTPRVLEIAEAFGIGLEEREFVVFDKLKLEVRQGDIVYITGQSGGGKSVLLRELQRQIAAQGKSVVNLDDIQFDMNAALIDQIGTDTNDAIRLLAMAGINDAYLYVRTPGQLSDGQRYRLRLAKAIEAGAQAWFADEFMAVLDRTSARVIAYSLQKVARRAGATVVVATTHTDLGRDLFPDVRIDKRFREKLEVAVADHAAQKAADATFERDDINELMLKGIQ